MRCPACGEENPERARFCLQCGTALVQAGQPASRESRRTVTVVFADMVGFTSLGESLDQESLRRVMDRFYGEMRGAIEAQDGTLAKFIGDAVLAVWGTPEVREDDALRAVRAADAMRGALAGLNEDLENRWGVRVGMRTGVNTGEVVVDPARPADLLVGDTLNVAARLEQAAADGEVLVGADTYRLVRDEVVLEPVEPLALKGKARPLPAWRLVDAERRKATRLQAPLVGREEELAALRAALGAVTAGRACRMTTVIGSPGLGKTRLVAEFIRSVGDDATVLHGRCQATGEGITFQPVAEALRGAADIDDDDTPETARAKLGAVLPGDEPDRDRVIERAAGLLGLAPAATAEETFWAVRRILEALARERPVVLVHDDIHWGQPTFLDLLEHFIEWIRDAPVFVLALARPELREVRPGLAEPGESTDVIALEPLDAEASRAMVSGLLGAADLPEGLARRVLETTEGNPLFLGETLRMLADEGVLRREGDTWVAGDVTDVTVPPTINALLSARIERLGAEERSVVERAAVIGHAFYRGAVTELSPPAIRPGVDGALETLSRKEMVRPEDEWWLDEQVFRFHHVLIRDAAYRSLLKEARAELHERFAAWLEAKAGVLAGEHEEVIAFHLEQSHAYRLELGPLDEPGRELAARAAARLHSAGRRALAREDLPAAENLLRRALAPLAADQAGRLHVLVDLAEALLSAGDTGAAEDVVEELGLGADELGDERLRAWAVVFAAQLDNLTGAGHVRDTASAAGAAAESLAAAADRAGEAKAHQVVAQAEALLGQVAAAEAALDRALVAARAADDRRRITAVLSGAPRAALWGPAPIVRASGRCLDVVRILRMTPGNRHVEAAALRSQAVLEAMRGRAEAARGILDTCRMTLEELGLTLELHETGVHAGIVELLAGDPAAAEQHLLAAHDGFRALGVEGGAAQAAALLARALLDQGRDAEAVEQTRVAEEHGGEDLKTTIAWLGVRAEAVARRGEHDEALGLARRAVALAEPTDALADKADALMALAAVEAAAGDETSARAAAGRARELYAAKDHTVGMRRAEAIAGRAQDEPAGEAPAPGAAQAEARPSPGATGPEAAAMRAWEEAFAAHDWARLREFYAPDVVLRDHRTGLRHEVRGREAVLDVLRGALPIHAEVRQQLLLAPPSPHAMTLRWILGGVNEDGSEWEVVQDQVMAFDSLRRIVLIEVMDDRRALLRRFDELSGVAPTPLVHRTAARCCAAVNGREWDTLAALLAPGSTVVDRRAARVQEELGADELGRVLRSCADGSPDLSCELTPVGAAGELVGITLGVVTGTHASGDRFELRALGVAELDDDGRPRRVVVFDEPDAEAARRLMREWARGHALAIPPWVPAADAAAMAMERWTSAFNAQDVDGMAAMIAPDFVAHDHRPGIRHSMDGNEWLGVWRWLFETVPDVRVEVLVLQSRPDAVHARMRFASDASDYEILMDAVSALCDGRTTLVESFEAGDPAAVALFAERPSAERRPVRLAREWAEAFNAREWDRAVALLAPLYATDDRRPLGIGYVQGPAEGVQAVRSIAEVGPEAVWSFATLESGEHAGLFECTIEGRPPDGGGFSAETLMVIAAGRRGIVRRSVFDPDQREQALAEYRAWAAHGAQLAGFEDAVNRHDFAAIRDHLAPDFRQEDRRRLGASVALDAEAFVEMMRTSERLMPSMAAQLDVVAVVADRRVTRMLYTGRAAGEGEVEVELWTVTRMHDGRMSESVLFESREEAEAALRAAPGGDQTTWKEHEEAVRATVRAWASRDPEAIRALLHHDFTQRDLRASGVSPPAGVEAFVEVARSIWSLVPDLAVEQRVVAVVGPRRVARAHWSGHLADGGGAMDLEFFILAEVRDGRLLSNELYDTEAAAMAALHAGGEADPWAAAHAEHARRYGELWSPDTVEKAVPEFYARDMRLVDHRPIGTMGDLDYAGYLEQMRSMAGTMEAADAVLDVVATEGPVRLARSVVRGLAVPERSPFEMETWYVTRLDGAGRISEQHFFGGEADAREWWLREVAGAAGRDWAAIHAEHSRRSSALYDPQASESVLAELFAPGFRLVDHRPLGTFGDVDLQGFREQVTSVIGVATGVATQVEVPRIEGRRRLARLLVRGGSPETGADSWEAEAWNVVTLDDAGRAVRIDVFGEQAEADAWLTHAAGLQAFEDALNSGRDEEVRRVITEDFRQRDRRQVSADEVDADGFVGMLRSARELVEDMHVRFELVAVRGARRVGRSVYRGSEPQGGGEIALEFWSLSTMREGRTAASDLFDNPDEALEALRQLDEPGRLAPDAAVARGSGSVQAVYDRMTRAFNARDWEGLEQCIGDGFRWTDHRAGLRDEAGDRDGFMVVMRAMAGRGDVRWTYDVIDQAPGRELVRVTLAGSFHGGPFEVRALDLHVLGPDGRFASADIFDEHDEAAARAVWAQQSAAAPHPLERFFRAHAAAVADRDFDRLSELLSEEYTLVSHQSGKRETRHGREEGVLARRAAVEVAGLSGVSNEVELLETRGERLGLARATWRGEFHGGPFEVTFVAVVELDAEGRLLRDESYDVADLDRARARLDEIASRDGRPGDGSAAALLASWTDAVNRGDRAAMGAFFAEDFVHDDHRPGMRHTFHGHEAQMANWGIALGAVPDLYVTARVVREAGPVLLLRITISSDEQAFEIEQDQVSTLRGGLVERAEVFEAGDPAATARFEALAASAAPASNVTLAEEQEHEARELREPLSAAGREPAGPDALAPLARVYAAMELGFNECDWTQHDRVLREDYRWVDLRPGLRVETTGREAFVDLMRTIREGNDLRWIQTPLEEGADGRVGLARVVQTGTYRGGPYEISFLVINALDDEGRGYLTETVADDLPEGHRRLEEVALHHGISNRGQDLINARDFDGLRELVHEDFRQEDHRELGAEPIVGREAYVAMLEDLVRWAPDTRLRMEVIAVAGDHRVTRQLWSGHGAETGAAWESELWAVNTVRDGRSARAEVHSSEEDARAALARGRDGPLRSPPADGS